MPEIVAKKWAQKLTDLGYPTEIGTDITGDTYVILPFVNITIHSEYLVDHFYQCILSQKGIAS
jgi:hypothetical protein